MELLRLLLSHPVASAVALGAVYLLWVVLDRLYLSPIARFPGPKLAALTHLYEFYWDTLCCGQFTFQIGRLHEKYGPIVRISPTELHVNDPDYYEVLYSRDSPRNKYEYYQKTLNAPLALLNTIDHHLHRRLRAQLNPFFSNARIRKQEPAIKSLVDKLCRRLEELKNTGQPLNIEHALTCYTTDVITNYSMGDGYHYLDAPDFIPRWHGTLTGTAKTMVFIRPVAWALPLLLALPERVTAWLNPGMELFFDFQRRCRKMIKRIVAAHNEKGDQAVQNGASVNIFEDILRSDLPAKNKSETRLAQEMQVLVSAGAETTAKAITYILFYLLNDPETMKKLKAEVETVGEDAPLIQLEQLPYLTGVMLEGIRLSYGVSARLPRIAPYNALKFRDWTIPPGTPVSMSCLLMHHNETVFPDSHRFKPERWLDPAERKRLEKYMVAFSKGSRQCIGIHLAKAEILLSVTALLRRMNLELYETTVEDVAIKHDIFIPFARMDSKGVRVLIK
ncbi:trichodiene oxygenase [Aspergillus udagawae]|uniref:Trichodiene oxygenase n=1 Tax=Aspergillus udagawae TaxID=91492 RepID=A0ABQ1AD32_9EURO|nr:trichodiene oxygenase [Aspergillus udagawae]GFF79170.1 trichodiene oxygenase [Aspergillus udagawae]GFG13475.1 trichodiene oxygenase [Aspergillus udagawae]GFG21275.1 trichodiene oxygenase [Aspergillus udagawae]